MTQDKMGPPNPYVVKLACACSRPLPERDPERGAVQCVRCGHPVVRVRRTRRVAA